MNVITDFSIILLQYWWERKAFDWSTRRNLLFSRAEQQSLLHVRESIEVSWKLGPRPIGQCGLLYGQIFKDQQIQIPYHSTQLFGAICTVSNLHFPSWFFLKNRQILMQFVLFSLIKVQSVVKIISRTAISVWKSHCKVGTRTDHWKYAKVSRCCCLFNERFTIGLWCGGTFNGWMQNHRSIDNSLLSSSRYWRIHSQRRDSILIFDLIRCNIQI